MNIPSISLSTNFRIPTTITAKTTQLPNHHHQQPKPLKNHLKTTKSQLDEAFHLIQTTNPPSTSSYTTFLSSCIAEKSLLHGQKLYLHLLLNHPTTLLHHPTILSKFITLFCIFPDQLDEASLMLEHAVRNNTYKSMDESIWFALFVGFLDNGYPEKALVVYSEMLHHRVEISGDTGLVIVKAFKGVRDLGFGRSVHSQIVKADKEVDGVIYDALLDLYNGLGSFDEVCKMFETMPKRDVESWKTLLVGFVERNMVLEAFSAFRRMVREGMCFDWDCLVTVLSGCRYVAMLNVVKEIHAQMVKSNEEDDINALNVLLDMYANCGEMEYCMRVFDAMEVKDAMSWNNVLNGYAINGFVGEVTELFQEMLKCGIRPDRLTFSALLTGCSHSGLIDGVQVLFDRMRREFQIEPDLEHYACLVDIYGKGGRIEEALEMVKLMPMEPSDNIYGSLLNSCRLHGHVSLAEEIFEQILELGPNYFKNYIIMSNIYADVGMWEGVKRVRGIMEKRRIRSVDMCSWIQIKDQVYMFVEGLSSKLCNSDEFKKLWDDLNERPDREDTFHGSIDNVRTDWVRGHCERVATVFGLVHCAPGIPIRITSNSLVCKACHSWMKNVSKVTRRMIILRDTDQIHHFHEGKCCCKSYWCSGTIA
ncbi:hypothetical protein LIER_32596 [Lithospermum erythrorhizon]|uniref:DYW domain-containing protein n=1 Tax=Lithospermum erythrorhizon TaxID=34254 RepID=A0AAV3RU97_LITER